jgi:UDP-N-acetyl-D-mannosaminuronate dehydrogenase
MQKRCLTGTIFEKFLCKGGFIHKSKSPKVKYSGEGKSILSKIKNSNYDAVVISVGHTIFKELGIKKIRKFTKAKSVIFDIKSLFSEKDLLRL